MGRGLAVGGAAGARSVKVPEVENPGGQLKAPISLDGVRMRVVSTAEGGEVGAGTVFEFAQDGAAVSARYAGGGVRLGYLVGVLSAAGLRFRYAQLGADGRLDGGHSTCEVGRTAEGRLRLVEHFEWDSREGAGTNIFEEEGGGGRP